MAGPGDENQISDLHELCIEGNFAKLKSILETRKGLDVNEYKLFVYRPLPNNSNERDNLIDGEDEYQSDEELSQSSTMFDYRSPLFYAILHNRLACVKLLIDNGANTDKLRPWGLNALCLSCYCGHPRLVEYFLNLNLNANVTDKPSATDNYFSSLSNEHEHKIKMREMHSRVAQDMGMFHYPLHIVVKQDNIDLIKLLLNYKQKFDMEIKEPYTKRTALHIAAGKCLTEVISLLLEDGQCEENPIDLNGHTPLDIVWKILNNLDYEFEYREDTLKLSGCLIRLII